MPRRVLLFLLALSLGPTLVLATAPAAVAADRDCGDFASQKAAQIFFLNAGGPSSDPHYLDSDGDGIACESNPAPYYYGKTLPGGGGSSQPEPEPQPQPVTSSVSLTVSPSQRITGERYDLTVTVRPAISRAVTVQKKVNGTWKVLATGTTGAAGTARRALKTPAKTLVLRAVLQPLSKAGKKYTGAVSTSRKLQVQRQKVELEFSQSVVSEGEQTRAVVTATPVRPGRPVALQVKEGGSWVTLEEIEVDRRGRAATQVVPELGTAEYRAVALRHNGAVPASSGTRDLTAVDMTAPAAPFGLQATAGDAVVDLTWSADVPADFLHHEVWVRTADTDWAVLATTTASVFQASGLQNGTTYWFAVSSLDRTGNRSAPTGEVTATPEAPVVEPVDQPSGAPGRR
ncbi:unannotated protein [freshwater metagenome]|uniref:Unannotated protein n=1 Tax=freshwater metagenome TaxID=449393 RepID=A0A6J6TQJ4_9ZZZZ|nr:hypothetical protein [Actinomycetota bacterium]